MTTLPNPDCWYKSSRSANNADCVEVSLGENVGIRDTKDRAGGQLAITPTAWRALLDRHKA